MASCIQHKFNNLPDTDLGPSSQGTDGIRASSRGLFFCPWELKLGIKIQHGSNGMLSLFHQASDSPRTIQSEVSFAVTPLCRTNMVLDLVINCNSLRWPLRWGKIKASSLNIWCFAENNTLLFSMPDEGQTCLTSSSPDPNSNQGFLVLGVCSHGTFSIRCTYCRRQ